MSHSTVLVIGPRNDEELERALAPFNEELRVEPYHDYVEPAPEGWEQTIANRQRFADLMENGMARGDAWKLVWGEENDDPRVPWPLSLAAEEGIDPRDIRAVAEWYNAKNPDSDHYLVDEGGLYQISTYNPKSRWDWYQLGGRWAGAFVLKPGAQVFVEGVGRQSLLDDGPNPYDGAHFDRARWGDIDWERMGHEQVEQARKQYQEAMGEGATHREFIFGVKPGQTEDEYVKECVGFSTFAVLTPDGDWLERGHMGWWGIVGNEKEDEAWRDEWRSTVDHFCDDDTIVSVVDVHI